MSNIEDYNAKLEAIMAIPNDEVKEPSLPVDVALQEAEDLHYWSSDDAEALKNVGIKMAMIKDLPVRAGACREAQSIWNKDYRSQKEAQKQWKVQSLLAYVLRDELIHTMRFVYRKNDALLGRVKAVAEGGSHADMIQDLNDLAVLGRENTEALAAISYDLTKLDQAASLADEMADLLAEANGDKAEQNGSKIIRDRAFTYMKELVDEIRECGKFLFWKDPSRYKGYISSYWQKKKNKGDDTGKQED